MISRPGAPSSAVTRLFARLLSSSKRSSTMARDAISSSTIRTVVRTIRSEIERGLAGEAARRVARRIFRRAPCTSEQELEERLGQHALGALHRTAVVGPITASVLDDLESAEQDAPSLAFSDLSDLARAV